MIAERIPEKTVLSSIEEAPARVPELIGEGLHILNPFFAEAVKNQNEEFLISRAKKEITAGADALAINLGPGKAMLQQTPWVIETLAEAVDIPLFVSSGILSCHKLMDRYGARIVVNAVTADPASLAGDLKTARLFNLRLAVLLVRPGLVPAGTHDRLLIAADVIGRAVDIGLPLQHLYLDPVITCRADPLAWKISRGMPDIQPVLETVAGLKDLAMGVKTIVALNNGSQGITPEKKSSVLGRTLRLFAEAGLDAVILNCLDKSLMAYAGQELSRHFPQ